MAISVLSPKKPDDEMLNKLERAEVEKISRNSLQQHDKPITEAKSNLEEARRQVSRAKHEVARLESHRQKVVDFCKKNKIKLEEEE